MSDHDFDTNGPSEQELRDLLRSLPRQQAPAHFEPELMRRVAGVRRWRSLFGVLHTTARSEWVGGLVSAGAAAVAVAGAWLYMQVDDASPRPAPTARVAAAAASRPAMPGYASSHAPTPQTTVANAPEPGSAVVTSSAEPRSSKAKPKLVSKRTRRVAGSGLVRRPKTAPPSVSAITVTPIVLDTIHAARLRVRPAPQRPRSSEAGLRQEHDRATVPAPVHDDATVRVDTGAHAR